MNTWNGLKLLFVTLILLGAAMLNHDGTLRGFGEGWRMIYAPQAVKVESFVKGARDLLDRPLLWIPGPDCV
ncbi:MAG: hypothetical protein EOP85_10610 [Verrucomicrobiaceae bacterium]|nr:MAG: hypothetical protein EOP85_10610 [Verrucomicrobiaceae bacterium]